MQRRQFLATTAAIALLSAAARAQNTNAMPRVAVLDWGSPVAGRPSAFGDAMRELGYLPGRNIVIDYFFAEGDEARARAFTAQILKRPVDVIVAFTTPAAHIVKQATTTIPIVVGTADPLGAGLVTNLARPGGNLTGSSAMLPELKAKHIELLRELIPAADHFGFVGSRPDPATQAFLSVAQKAADQLRVLLTPVLIDGRFEIGDALRRLSAEGVQATLVQPLFVLDHEAAAAVAQAAIQHGMPAIAVFQHFVEAGGLVSYGPRANFNRRGVARYVDRILRGAAPGDLPIEQPTEFVLAINQKVAKALGIAVPEALLARADQVID